METRIWSHIFLFVLAIENGRFQKFTQATKVNSYFWGNLDIFTAIAEGLVKKRMVLTEQLAIVLHGYEEQYFPWDTVRYGTREVVSNRYR